MGFDVQGARDAGYSDAEIADHLAKGANYNIGQARKAGYSDGEIIDHLVKLKPSAPVGADRAIHEQRLKNAEQDIANSQANAGNRRALNVLQAVGDFVGGVQETGANLASQAVAAPVAGLAGVASTLIPGVDSADVVEGTQRALTYQPRTDVGQEAQGTIAKPFMWAAGKADRAGEAVARATGSPALGAAVNTGIQALPVVLSKGTRGAVASAGRAAANTVARAVGADAGAAEAAAAEAQSTAAAATRAQDYVARTAGLDWNSLPGEIQAKLTDIAKSAGSLEQLDPAALKRYAQLQGGRVPVPATRGQILRDPVQMRREGNAAATTEGAPIRETFEAADNALQANLDALRGRVAGTGKTAATATNPEEAGSTIQGAARAKAAASKANYDRLYKIARETEPNARAPITPVTDLLTQNPEIQHLGWVQTWLNRAAKLAGGKEGEPIAITDATPAELADLRSQAAEIARTGGKEGLYAGKVAAAIDQAMESVPAAAKAWRAANAAYKAHKMEFSEQGAVGDLVDQSTRTDRATALENTAKTITNGSLEDIRKVKSTLLTGGDEATRTAGKQAWRELRAQVVDRIKEEATKGSAPKADGTPNVSVAKLKQVIDSYGPEKLDEIFGPGNAREIYRVLDNAQTVKTMPPGGIPIGSSTLQNVLSFLGKGLDKVPLVGSTAVDVARGVAKVKGFGENARAADSARTIPLNEAVDEAARRGARKSAREKLAGAKTLPISSLATGESRQ